MSFQKNGASLRMFLNALWQKSYPSDSAVLVLPLMVLGAVDDILRNKWDLNQKYLTQQEAPLLDFTSEATDTWGFELVMSCNVCRYHLEVS